MDEMLSAIKARRGLLGSNDSYGGDGDNKSELKALIETLDDSQKSELLNLLAKDQGMTDIDPSKIQKGGMSSGEREEIEQDMDSGMDDQHESEDDIAESMLSSSDKMRADQDAKPRNLGDRMKLALAKKLKGKGV